MTEMTERADRIRNGSDHEVLTRTPRRSRRRALGSLLAVAATSGVLAATLGTAGPAGAAFPGNNGKIAYAAYDAVSYNIWVMNPDGSNRTYLTSSLDWETDPAFSPDGSKIAYTRGETTGDDDIWVMNADGTGQTNLTPGPGQDGNAAWSPDGSKIAFESTRGGNWDDLGHERRRLRPDEPDRRPRDEGDPAWSPDGSKIALRSHRDGNGEIYVMNADGSGQTNLTQQPGHRRPSRPGRRTGARSRSRPPRRRHRDLRDERGRLRPDEPDQNSDATQSPPGRRTAARSRSRAGATATARST